MYRERYLDGLGTFSIMQMQLLDQTDLMKREDRV
jgi:hypothetical protein